ncbi:MAG: sigma-70 family RNA polymerase sigma factor [Chitinophagales bacterium]
MRLTHLSDQELIHHFVNGSESAFQLLVERHKEKIYTAIYLKVRDAYLAEDILQEAFIKAVDYVRKGRYKEENKFTAWVGRIAFNLCMDHFRQNKRNPETGTDSELLFKYLPFEQQMPDDHMDVMRAENRLKRIIDMLPAEQREVIMLRHYFNFSFKEIAEQTNSPLNTCLARARYGLLNLRKLIEKHKVDVSGIAV